MEEIYDRHAESRFFASSMVLRLGQYERIGGINVLLWVRYPEQVFTSKLFPKGLLPVPITACSPRARIIGFLLLSAPMTTDSRRLLRRERPERVIGSSPLFRMVMYSSLAIAVPTPPRLISISGFVLLVSPTLVSGIESRSNAS